MCVSLLIKTKTQLFLLNLSSRKLQDQSGKEKQQHPVGCWGLLVAQNMASLPGRVSGHRVLNSMRGEKEPEKPRAASLLNGFLIFLKDCLILKCLRVRNLSLIWSPSQPTQLEEKTAWWLLRLCPGDRQGAVRLALLSHLGHHLTFGSIDLEVKVKPVAEVSPSKAGPSYYLESFLYQLSQLFKY